MHSAREIMHYLEKELRELIKTEESIFKFVEEGSLDGLWYWDLENPEQEWMSPRFWETFGFDPAKRKHLASEWQDLIHPSDLNLANENFQKHCEDSNHKYDQYVRYKNNQTDDWTWVRCRGLVIKDSDGKPIRMVGTHIDVTELKNSESRLNRAQTIAKIGDWEFHVETQKIRWSPQMFALFLPKHTSRQEPSFEELSALIHPDDLTLWSSTVQKTLETGDPWIIEFRVKHDENEYIWIQDRGEARADAKGKVTWLIGTCLDITESKKNQIALKNANDSLQEKNQDLSIFAHAASHDLQSPIKSMMGLLEIMQEDLDENHLEDLSENIQSLKKCANRAQKLINAALTLGKVQNESINLEVLDAIQLIRDIWPQIKSERNITEEVSLDFLSRQFMIDADKEMFSLLIRNILSNSWKYRDQTRRLELSISTEENQQSKVLILEDNGIGMSKEECLHATEFFKRFHTSNKIEGTGLGLGIAKQVVSRHNWKLVLEPGNIHGLRIKIFI
ncbi:MAG: PAS domain-containing protein [Pseudobacteriovorax sp.]|nr:PAS domain-containing protein [Pseudobacteriovorax sp.]